MIQDTNYFDNISDISHCRLCRHALNISDSVSVGPFPKSAQYFPELNELELDHGVWLKLVECDHCGLTQLTNSPVSYFRQVITTATNSPTLSAQRMILFERLKSQISSGQMLKAIEIGCGTGGNLPLLRSAGFEALGTEYSPTTQGTQVGNSDIFNCYILDLDENHNHQYDLIASFNYLEHQPDTLAFLQKCHDILTDEGKLLLTIPNFEHLLASQSAHEFVSDHLVYFSPHSITEALHRTGFTIEELSIINNQYDIQVIARKSSTSSIASCKKSLDSLVTTLNARLQELASKGMKIAIWGAGHRTLALLSLCEHKLISCVIDSATFKQNRFTPLSHLKILSPDILNETDCDIDIILVMLPGIYPSEVIKRIKALPIHYEAEQFPQMFN